jgi:hypothetical protein
MVASLARNMMDGISSDATLEWRADDTLLDSELLVEIRWDFEQLDWS